MESLKERMAKASTVAVRRGSLTKQFLALMNPPASEGVIVSRPVVPVIELPTVMPIHLHSQPCSLAASIVTLAEPAVHTYATMRPD